MEKNYVPKEVEEKIYRFWEKKGLFEAKVDRKKTPFSIILPPPNANADLHLGHAMYTYEDVMIRYHKMIGEETLWLPGADHAGFETQFVFEQKLKKEGKSRFDYDRETLYKMIWDFVIKNKSNMETQLKRLGFALDWSKNTFTLDPKIVRIVYETFKKLDAAGLLYRAKRLVNYCVVCGTSFSDLEVLYVERKNKLWFIKYPIKDSSNDYLTVATTRPETMLGDTAVAVNPKDERYKRLIGKKAILPIVGREIPIVADEAVDPKFATGAVKVTPAHDETDWQIAQRHSLPLIQVIDFNGKMSKEAGEFAGLTISEARLQILERLKKLSLLEKEKDYLHRVGRCYKCGRFIEPLPKEQWFIKVRPLAEEAKKLIEKGEITIYPRRFKKILLMWLTNFRDWNVSRQIVWGIRIPAYYCKSNKKWFICINKPERCHICGGKDFVQDTDTFDTWFSSSQWPYATLLTQSGISNIQYPISQKKSDNFFDYFYPTSVMETGYDILPWWVARMIMIGYFTTGKVPFRNVFLHGMVRDRKGQKMSKSKGNIINPIDMIDKYGADALRAALLFEVKEGSDVVVFEEKIKGMRNFANKLWNMGRFINMNQSQKPKDKSQKLKLRECLEMEKEFKLMKANYKKCMDSYQFSKALGLLYEFIWHRLADIYIERLKNELKNGNIYALEALQKVYLESLKLLHPFMPFVTEAIWQVFKGEESSILNSNIKIQR